jgi:hypothetical protein
MHTKTSRSFFPFPGSWLAVLILVLPFTVQIMGCNFSVLKETTQVAQDQTATASVLQSAVDTQVAETSQAVIIAATETATQPPETEALPPTQAPATPTSEPGPTFVLPPTPLPPAVQPPAQVTTNSNAPTALPPASSIDPKFKSANILLYEDIAGNSDLTRYVSASLKRLGLPFTDLGDAQGRLKQALLSGANGKPWDLVIIAAEDRNGVQGEFFQILEQVLAQGTSVILEAWHLDEIREGAAKPVLLRCGVDVVNWFGGSRSPSALAIYPLQPNHPVLNLVIPVKQFRVADYWPYEDQGDLMYLTGTGDAQLILGTHQNDPKNYGVLAECMKGHLILQTYASHNYTNDTSVPLWMNYIDYALQQHFQP